MSEDDMVEGYRDGLNDDRADFPASLSNRGHSYRHGWLNGRDNPPTPTTPIDMLLWCPTCHTQHVDAPDERTEGWVNPQHRSHLCHHCGTIWRPADVPTNGVAAIATRGKSDTWPEASTT